MIIFFFYRSINIFDFLSGGGTTLNVLKGDKNEKGHPKKNDVPTTSTVPTTSARPTGSYPGALGAMGGYNYPGTHPGHQKADLLSAALSSSG